MSVANKILRPKLEAGINASNWSPCSVYTSSLIKQTADGILLEVDEMVADSTSGLTERVGALEITASGISQTVSAHTQSISGNTYQIGQLNVRADRIEGRVEEIENGGVVPNLLPQNGWMDKNESFIDPTDDMCYSASTSRIVSPKVHLEAGTYCISSYNNAGNRFSCYYNVVNADESSIQTLSDDDDYPVIIEWVGGTMFVTASYSMTTKKTSPYTSDGTYNNKPITKISFDTDVTSVTNLKYNPTSLASSFVGCSKLTSVDLSNCNMSGVTTMYGMMQYCSGLTSVDFSSCNISNKLTNIGYAFYGCTNLTTIDLSNADLTNVTDTTQVFNGCTSLTSVTMANCSDDSINVIRLALDSAGLTSVTITTTKQTTPEPTTPSETPESTTPSETPEPTTPSQAPEQTQVQKVTLTPTITSSTTDTYNDCTRYYSVYTIEDDNDYYFLYGTDSTDSVFYRPKLESGEVPTAYEDGSIKYSSLIEQTAHQINLSVKKDDLEQVGIHLDGDNSEITAVADKFHLGGFTVGQDKLWYGSSSENDDDYATKKAIFGHQNIVIQDSHKESNDLESYYRVSLGKDVNKDGQIDNVMRIVSVNKNPDLGADSAFFKGNIPALFVGSWTANAADQIAIATSGGIRVEGGPLWQASYEYKTFPTSMVMSHTIPYHSSLVMLSNNTSEEDNRFVLPLPSEISRMAGKDDVMDCTYCIQIEVFCDVNSTHDVRITHQVDGATKVYEGTNLINYNSYFTVPKGQSKRLTGFCKNVKTSGTSGYYPRPEITWYVQ